jgi:hypothetical protein
VVVQFVLQAMCYSLPTPDDPFLNKRTHRKKRDSFQPNRSAESVVEVPTSDTEAARRGEKPGKPTGRRRETAKVLVQGCRRRLSGIQIWIVSGRKRKARQGMHRVQQSVRFSWQSPPFLRPEMIVLQKHMHRLLVSLSDNGGRHVHKE